MLEKITERTTALWYEVNKKYGEHVYNLGVNGCGDVILCKGYGEDIARGNGNVQKKLRELLKA